MTTQQILTQEINSLMLLPVVTMAYKISTKMESIAEAHALQVAIPVATECKMMMKKELTVEASVHKAAQKTVAMAT